MEQNTSVIFKISRLTLKCWRFTPVYGRKYEKNCKASIIVENILPANKLYVTASSDTYLFK